MSDPEDQDQESKGNGAVPEQDSSDSEPDTEPAADDIPAEAAAPDPLAEAKSELARLRDQLLRTAADFDNYRKRTRRELADAEARSREDTLKDLLPVFDNLERAVQHAEGATDVQGVVDGIRIVLRQFLDTLGKLGVQRVESVGKPFDPAVHEAIQHLPSSDYAPGTVMAEAQPGYKSSERLIRPALVVVSKGGPAGDSSESP